MGCFTFYLFVCIDSVIYKQVQAIKFIFRHCLTDATFSNHVLYVNRENLLFNDILHYSSVTSGVTIHFCRVLISDSS